MFDPAQLASFVAVARRHSFSGAARQLGLRQSTVSQHVRKLEEALGRRLFVRDTHSVTLTADGDTMIEFARAILDANETARRYFATSVLEGRVRLGASEDFVVSRLPDVLRDFRRLHPAVDLELTVGLSEELYDKLDGGELDLLIAKRREGDARGQLLWRERLAWVSAESWRPERDGTIPLILYRPPSVTRAAAIEALDAVRRPWRIVCSSGSLSGLRAAALAGLGVTVQSRALMVDGLRELPASAGLPPLAETEFVVVGRTPRPRGPAGALAAALLANADGFQSFRA